MKDKRRRFTGKQRVSRSILERINPNVAGIDCGSAEHYVAVPADRDPECVRAFNTFTGGLEQLADWLVACRITHAAMESTGVYWIPVFEILESRGIEVVLVNAHHVKNVPGRKTDVSDCEWLRELHSVGLLRGSFRPKEGIVVLRAYSRHRQTLVQQAAVCTNRMQKALVQMNLQLPLVVTDITGVTGLRILRDIAAGQRDPQQLAEHRDSRCKATKEKIAAALTGSYRPEHLFVLKQNLELFDTYQAKIAACDQMIHAHMEQLTAQPPAPADPLPESRKPVPKKRQGNEPSFDVRGLLYQITGGIDITQIDGLGDYSSLQLISEIGVHMSRWPSEKHFTSWLTLAPNNRISGGRLLSSRTQPSANRAARIFRLAAMTVSRTQTGLGAFYRRLAGRIGKPQAITATARKIAVLVYRMLKRELVYKDPGASGYDAQQKTRSIRRLRQRAAALGFDLIHRPSPEPLTHAFS